MSSFITGPRSRHVIAPGLTMGDLYEIVNDRLDYVTPRINTDVHAVCQCVCVEVEKKLGIFPNTGEPKESGADR